MPDSNQRPSHYECDALPTELMRLSAAPYYRTRGRARFRWRIARLRSERAGRGARLRPRRSASPRPDRRARGGSINGSRRRHAGSRFAAWATGAVGAAAASSPARTGSARRRELRLARRCGGQLPALSPRDAGAGSIARKARQAPRLSISIRGPSISASGTFHSTVSSLPLTGETGAHSSSTMPSAVHTGSRGA